MALTRAFLKGMGITDEQVSAIIEAHTETTDALKAQRDNYKAEAEKNAGIQKELDELKASGGDWQEKFEKEHADFEAYKTTQKQKEEKAVKESAYRKLLTTAGVSENRLDAIMRLSGDAIDAVIIEDDGTIKDSEKLTESVKTEWSDYIITQETTGADTSNPPGSSGDSKPNIPTIF